MEKDTNPDQGSATRTPCLAAHIPRTGKGKPTAAAGELADSIGGMDIDDTLIENLSESNTVEASSANPSTSNVDEQPFPPEFSIAQAGLRSTYDSLARREHFVKEALLDINVKIIAMGERVNVPHPVTPNNGTAVQSLQNDFLMFYAEFSLFKESILTLLKTLNEAVANMSDCTDL